MRITIIGYGKMGKEIEKIALERGHTISAKIGLENYDDLEIFYQDMENEDGDLYIPNRRVEAAHKRPLSRNTNYMLTYPEAEHLRQDPRVEAVELTPDLLNYTPDIRLTPDLLNSRFTKLQIY